jgi:hypothetical protein
MLLVSDARSSTRTNGAPRGHIRATTDLISVNGGKIARAEVAQFVVEQLATDTWPRGHPSSCGERCWHITGSNELYVPISPDVASRT